MGLRPWQDRGRWNLGNPGVSFPRNQTFHDNSSSHGGLRKFLSQRHSKKPTSTGNRCEHGGHPTENTLGPFSLLSLSSQPLLSIPVKVDGATAHFCHPARYCDNSIYIVFSLFSWKFQRVAGKSFSIKTEVFLKVENPAYTLPTQTKPEVRFFPWGKHYCLKTHFLRAGTTAH